MTVLKSVELSNQLDKDSEGDASSTLFQSFSVAVSDFTACVCADLSTTDQMPLVTTSPSSLSIRLLEHRPRPCNEITLNCPNVDASVNQQQFHFLISAFIKGNFIEPESIVSDAEGSFDIVSKIAKEAALATVSAVVGSKALQSELMFRALFHSANVNILGNASMKVSFSYLSFIHYFYSDIISGIR